MFQQRQYMSPSYQEPNFDLFEKIYFGKNIHYYRLDKNTD
jgi:hypothetical protein